MIEMGTLSTVVGVLLAIFGIAVFVEYLREGDLSDAAESVFDGAVGMVLGFATLAVISISAVGSIVGEAPGAVTSIAAAGLGWLAIEERLGISGGMFALAVVALLVVAIALREA